MSLYNSTLQLGMATGAALGGFEIEHMPIGSIGWSAAGLVLISLLFAMSASLISVHKPKISVN